MRYLIKNGSIIDPARRVATVGNVLIENGKVSRVMDLADLSTAQEPLGKDLEVINARGAVIAPGFIDLHTHLREPGEEHKETIATGTAAAARGGFTTVCAMPNTRPPHDRVAVVRQVLETARAEGSVRVEPIGAITLGRAGKNLTEMAELVEAGCIAFSDDGSPVSDPAVMRNALAYAAMLGVPIMSHCEDLTLSRGWAMHEGAISTRLGLPGYPAAAEEVQIARDIALAEMTGAHIHICHVSTAGGVALVRAAKERGVRVTAEATPHHLTLTDRWVLGSLGEPVAPREPPAPPTRGKRKRKHEPELGLPAWLVPTRLPPYDTSTRVSPPLRSDEDVDALIEGLRDGTIDAIATDHAPHSHVDKECEYGLAAPGISGLETALGLVLTLVHRGEMDLVNLIAKLTEGPASVISRTPATLRPGSNADIVVFDPDYSWVVDRQKFVSKGLNTPVHGQRLKGQVMLTMTRGKIAFRRGNFGVSTGMLQQLSKLPGILNDEGES
ncbi:MAG: dihydroorotase [Chloroflexi bacterium SZAS-1]|jgi:dihydroorotase|nr:dihydroorotase [Chloroflexi bacterium SZAS-1]HNP86165.1 dihydroorotase [Kouleothrix sp.]